MSNEWRFIPGPKTQSDLKTSNLLEEIKKAIPGELSGHSEIATPKDDLLKPGNFRKNHKFVKNRLDASVYSSSCQ
jgi:hypothetical protein